MEDTKVTETVKTEELPKAEVKTEKTFTREEFNKAIAAEKLKLEKELTEKALKEKTEAEKLASMKAEERNEYELAKIRAEREEAIKKLNAYELRNEAQKIALSQDMNVDVTLLDLIDFNSVTAEELNAKINTIKTVFDNAYEKKLNDKLKETSPKNVQDSAKTQDAELRKAMGL